MTAIEAALAQEPPARLRRVVLDALPLLTGVALLMAGNGLTSTLLGIRAGLEGFGPTVTGVVLSGYYVGFLAGSLVTPSTIRRVGHVRVFAGLASLASAAVLLHVVHADPVTWLILRGASGLCTSGLYVVTETWLNGAATNSTRGGLLASYMVVVTGGLGVGQLLFPIADPGGHAAFVLASVLVSLAVVPVALATVWPPDVPDPSPMSTGDLIEVAPLAAVGAAMSGFAGAAMISAGPIYAASTGLGRFGTSALIFAALAGALVLQVPLGRWSDLLDRRRVMVATALLGGAAALAAAAAGPDRLVWLVLLTAVAGGTSFPLYSLSNAHLNDYLDHGRVVAAGARMVLLNGGGAIAGPIVGAMAIDAAGPGSFFVVLAASYVCIAGYAAYRLTRRPAASEAARSHYVPLPSGATPNVATLAEGAGEELYPPERGVVAVDDVELAYCEQGTGVPVILLHPPSGDVSTWDDALPALAVDGVRAIALQLRHPDAPVERHVDDVLALLRDRDIPVATFVGVDGAGAIVSRLLEEHRDRAEGAVLVGAPPAVAGDALGQLPMLRIRGSADDRAVADDDAVAISDAGERPHEDQPEVFADVVVDFLRHVVHPNVESM